MDTNALSDFATAVDAESVIGIDNRILDDPDKPGVQRLEPCTDCGYRHIPRRLVCCVDGTWMLEDGAEGCFELNPSNIFRIWMAVKEGPVKTQDGQLRQQTKQYFKGIGTKQRWWKKYWQGGLGAGYEAHVAEVYEHCAKTCCPSRDELFLFGYSRGAFICRAVATLFSKIGTLRGDAGGWEDRLADAINWYKNWTEGNTTSQPHADFHMLYSRDSPRVKFLGLFDTVKKVFSLVNRRLRPISSGTTFRQPENVCHVRHALALLENRDAFKLERVECEQGGRLPASRANRTCLEAWFLGSHADLGGGCKEDGLSLWPLQWILSEAVEYGLVIEFHTPELLMGLVEDPIEHVMPRGEGPHQIPYKNGSTVRMWDLNRIFERQNLKPVPNTPSGALTKLGTSERRVFIDNDTGSATIIHPSLYWADDVTPLGIMLLSPLSFSRELRQSRRDVDVRSEFLFWNQHHTRVVETQRSRTRVLICGPSGVGKSSLVNTVLKNEVSTESSGPISVEHDINAELVSEIQAKDGSDFVFHDANGFERGLEKTSRRVQIFLEDRQKRTKFEEQLHGIWYCCESTRRIETADIQFLRSTDFRGIPVILVFTKYDLLELSCAREAVQQYRQAHPDRPSFSHLRVPADAWSEFELRKDSILELRRKEREGLMRDSSMGDHEPCFVSIDYDDTVDNLCEKTRACLKSEVLLKIHDKAMLGYLKEVQFRAVNEALECASRKVDELPEIDPTSEEGLQKWALALRGFRKDLRLILPPLYGLDVPGDLNVEDYRELFSDLYQDGEIPHWWDDHAEFSFAKYGFGKQTLIITATLLVGTPLSWFLILFPAPTLAAMGVTYLANSVRTVHNANEKTWMVRASRALLVQAACEILLYEKLFWLGIKEVRSKEILARAAIEVLKQVQEIHRFFDPAGLEARGFECNEEVLSQLVTVLRVILGFGGE